MIYLPNNNFLNQWRALNLDEMKAQPAFQAVLDYFKDKGKVEPTFGVGQTPSGQPIVTFKFTNDSGDVEEFWAADAICDAYPTLSDLRRSGISKTSIASYDPFSWAPPAEVKQPPPAGPPVKPKYVVGNTYDNVHYENLGPIPYVGAETTDARGTFTAVARVTPFGTSFTWTLKDAAPVAPVAPVVPAAPASANPLLLLSPDKLQKLFDLAKMLGLL
jgi:hypothetical protein